MAEVVTVGVDALLEPRLLLVVTADQAIAEPVPHRLSLEEDVYQPGPVLTAVAQAVVSSTAVHVVLNLSRVLTTDGVVGG